MGNRNWTGIGVRLVIAVVLVGGGALFLGPGSGEKEFQKTLAAMKQVRTFRATLDTTPGRDMHNDKSWDVDCTRELVHYQGHLVSTASDDPRDISEDQISYSGRNFELQVDGSWAPMKIPFPFNLAPAKLFCGNLAQGTDTNILPSIATMIKRGVIQKGDKKTVNGVRCREWLVTLKGGRMGLEHETVCLGLDDHLPYELTVFSVGEHSTFSNYNQPVQFDIPQEALQTVSATH